MRRALTLIELILVIVIFGILASLGSEIIAKLYENRLIAQATEEASDRAQFGLEVIAKRLSYRVMDSEIARKSSSPASTAITLNATPTDRDILEWIGYAHDALRGEKIGSGSFNYPGYSGLCDLNASDKQKLVTPGGNLTIARNVIYKTSYNSVDLNSNNSGAAVIFKGGYVSGGDPITAFYTAPYPDVHKVHRIDDKTLAFENTGAKTLYEHYYLVYTAYAIVPVVTAQGDYNLTLYYDYRPWMGQSFSNGKKKILVAHVSRFKFRKIDRALELLLCATKKVSDEFNVTICGKKVVF